MQDAYPVRSTQPELINHLVKLVGGTTAVTKVFGPGVTVTYIGVGIVDITWSESPGTFLAAIGSFSAVVIAGVSGVVAAFGVYSESTRTLRLNIGNAAAGTPVDLAANQWLTVIAYFKQTAV
jgi:hypothetical protein